MDNENRQKIIVQTSIVGIITNVFLAAFKAVIGFLSHSIAISLDAVNNLSDALSSVITIIGAALGALKPDKDHPLGHGRIEYLSSLLVSAIVLYAGLTSLVESVKKIIHPEEANYSAASLIILAVAIVAKLILGQYVKRQGKKANSGALIASGQDAFSDAVLSASVLGSAIIFTLWNISLEPYVGAVISIFIIKSGYEMTTETLDDILGHRSDPELSRKIKAILTEEPEVNGAYDLLLHNYGPGKDYGSVHIELPDTMTVDEVDRLTRKVEMRVYQETGVILTGIGVYSYNTTNEEAMRIRNAVQKTVMSHDWVLQMHGFYVDTEKKILQCDVVISFDTDRKAAFQTVVDEVQALYPDYTLQIFSDSDISD